MKSLICIAGPTAVGKTSLSLFLAEYFNSVIISADSRQIYRYLNIGTAKASKEELERVPHFLINHLNPDEYYDAARFEQEAEKIIQREFENHDFLIVVGGSTLYLDALWYGIDPMPKVPEQIRQKLHKDWQEHGLAALTEELAQIDPQTHQQIDLKNPARVLRALEIYRATGKPISTFRLGKSMKKRPWKLIQIGLNDDRELLYARINQRVDEMIEAGLETEIKDLLAKGYPTDCPAFRSIGYQEWLTYFKGEIDRPEAIRLMKRNSRRYAKRQLTWFRREKNMHWFQAGEQKAVLEKILSLASE